MTCKVTFITFNSESNLLFSCGKDRAFFDPCLVEVIPMTWRHEPLIKIELFFLCTTRPGHMHACFYKVTASQTEHPLCPFFRLEWAVHHFQQFLHPTLSSDFACIAVVSSLLGPLRTKLFVFGAFQMVNFLVATRDTMERCSWLAEKHLNAWHIC